MQAISTDVKQSKVTSLSD